MSLPAKNTLNTPVGPPPPLNMATHPTRGHLYRTSSPLKTQQDEQLHPRPAGISKGNLATTNLRSPFNRPALVAASTVNRTPTLISPFTRPASDTINTGKVPTGNALFHKPAIPPSPAPATKTASMKLDQTCVAGPEISLLNIAPTDSTTKAATGEATPASLVGTDTSNKIPASPLAKPEPQVVNLTSREKVDPETRIKEDNLALAIAIKEVEEAEASLERVRDRQLHANQKTTFSYEDISLFTAEQEYDRAIEVLGFVREHYNKQYLSTPSALQSPPSVVRPLSPSKFESAVTATPPSTPRKLKNQATPSSSRYNHNAVQGPSGALDIDLLASPRSPYPNSKHYSIVVGWRVGVYTSWNQVKPLVEGLGRKASYQSFATYKEALDDYLQARMKGWVNVIRLPNDSDTIFGSTDDAEDL